MGEFAKRANEMMLAESGGIDWKGMLNSLLAQRGDTPEWKTDLEKQKARLRPFILPSEEEAEQKAQANIEDLQERARSMGYSMRARKREEEEPLLRDVGRGMPGREVVVDLPAIKQGWYEPRLRSKQADLLAGGLADRKPDTRYDLRELSRGVRVEMEHTSDPERSKEIAKDHLEEIPDYYNRLDAMEGEAEETREEAEELREKEGGVLGEMFAPVGMAAESALAEAARTISEKTREARRVTDDPSTLVSYYPRLATTVPKAFHEGFSQADEDADILRAEETEKAIAKAQKEYEKALAAEYAARKTAKTAGELIDGLAQAHVKSAQGEINQALGAYLALASLLGYGAHTASESWVKSRDPRQQKYKAVKEELRKKRMRQPAPILVEVPEPVDTEANLRT